MPFFDALKKNLTLRPTPFQGTTKNGAALKDHFIKCCTLSVFLHDEKFSEKKNPNTFVFLGGLQSAL